MNAELKSRMKEFRALVAEAIREEIAVQSGHFNNSSLGNASPEKVLEVLLEYISRGKMIRGGLAMLSSEMYGFKGDERKTLATALELIQSGFLIHDDIMDCDDIRRGKPAMHAYYKSKCTFSEPKVAQHYGVSMALCVGDLAFFMASSMIARFSSHSSLVSHEKYSLSMLLHQELMRVALGQMQDIENGLSDTITSEDTVLAMYSWKTASYTFALPLKLGCLLACMHTSEIDEQFIEKECTTLSQLAYHLGILFQLRDDELGLHGDVATLGKSIGVDLVMHKDTVYLAKLHSKMSSEERFEYDALRGSARSDSKKMQSLVSFVQDLLTKYSIADEISALQNGHVMKARECIDILSVTKEYKELLYGLADYVSARNK
ncbi:MAG: polyprenyl synthetase family protein [Candidatus Woesearchaeota archaeon]